MNFFYKTALLSALIIALITNVQGQSLRFTDTSYVSLGNDASLRLTSFTLEAWIKIEGYASTTETGTGGLAGVVPIITKGRAEAESAALDINYFLGYRLSDMRLVADFEDNATSANHPVVSAGAGGILPYCVWTHVAATYNTATDEWKLYVNGVLNTTLSAGGNFTPQSASNINACIGSTLNTGGSIRPGFFNGRMDEVRIWNLVRTDAEILANYNSQLISGTGLAGRWGLNENSGSSTANSIFGGPAGTLLRNPLWVTGFNQADPTVNSSLGFNGVEDYVTFGAAPGLNAAAFTLEAWIKIEGTGVATSSASTGATGVPIIAKGRSESDNPGRNVNYFFAVNSSNRLVADFEESNGTSHPITGVNAIPQNVWTHVAVTYGAGTWNLYINGVLDKTESEGGAVPETNSIQHASIGTAITSSSATPPAEPAGFFNGKIDEVRIWNLARTSTQISSNYNIELTSGTGLLGRWGLNENCNTTATNSVAGGVNGTIRATNISTHPTNGGPHWVSSGFNNLAPNQPTNPNPANSSVSTTTSPDVCANVSDPNGGNLRVRFYGRKKPAGGSGKFTFIILPDTQYYTAEPQGTNGGNTAMLNSQSAWIVANRVARNIVFVGGVGDCVQNGDNPPGSNNSIEWDRYVAGIAPIESPALTGLPQGIPLSVTVGNHDQTPNGNPAGTSNYYNQYFGYNHFNGRAYYGGHYGTDPNNNDNHYELFSASGVDFLVISMEYDQTAGFAATGGVLDWAEGLVQTYSSRKVIVLTHYGINEDQSFSTQGSAIYNRLRAYPNFLIHACGHVHTTDGEARRTDTYNGNTVHTMLSDYQGWAGGGNGLLRILEFDPLLNTLSVKTFSPYLNSFETDADSEFGLPVKLDAYSLIGETNVASGSNACVNWPGLLETTEYEWYAEIFDGENTTIGPLWTFTTPVNGPLPVSYFSLTATPETKRVRLNWRTSSEINNHHFNVERSTNGSTFIKIGEAAGNGTTTIPHDYIFYDNAPLKGRSFYRLQQVDINSKFKYSDIVAVKYGDKARFEIFPNPVTGGDINVYFNETVKGEIRIIIYDMGGKEAYKQNYNASAGHIRVQPGLSAGIYTVRITGNDINELEKIVVTGK